VADRDEQEDTRGRIHGAALTLFSERGFHGTGIRDLAHGAGTSSSTLYHYMGSKEELLMDVMTESMSMLSSAARESVEGLTSPREILTSLIRSHVRIHGEHQEAAVVVDNELDNLLPTDRSILVQERDDYEALWADALERGIADGEFRIGRPRMARLALVQMCTGVAYWYSPQGDSTLDEIGDYFAELGLQLAGAAVSPSKAEAAPKRRPKSRTIRR
jgi:AcrR family transcriptional regulator